MKKHRGHGSCLPCRNNSLGNLCGTSIDADDIDFTGSRSNLVYMDKVFAFKEATSCPILSCVNTGGMNANNFLAEIEIKDPSNNCNSCNCDGHNNCGCGNNNCGCCDCNCGCHITCNCNCSAGINRNSIFNIDKAFVVVEYFNTRPPGNAPCVSIDGYDVDCVKFSNGQFIVNTDQVNSEVQRERCQDAGLPTKTFLLINCAGPWDFRAKYILEGTVNTDGRVSCFRAEISNAPGRPNSTLPNTALSNFAIPNFSIPCTINGIAPSIQFQFGANIDLIRPKLTIKSRQPRPRGNENSDCDDSSRHSDCICICNNSNGEDFSIVLNGNLAIEPTVHVETIRKTLFCVNACEALQPCDGSELAAEMEDEDDIDPFAPDCACGNSVASAVSPAEDCGCNNHRNRVSAEEDCGCNNNNSNASRGSCSCGNGSRDRCQGAFQHNGCSGCSW